MDTTTVVWGIGFPLLLFFIGLGAGTAFAMTSSDSIGFLVAKACFAAATLDCVVVAIYWVISTQQPMPWNVVIPTIAAIIVVPALVLSLQWLSGVEAKLSMQLIAGKEPTPKIPIMPPWMAAKIKIPDDALKIFLGSNMAWTTKFPHQILEMAGEKMIEINKDKSSGELIVSVLKIFDDRNNIIARIDAEDGFWVGNSTRKKRPNPSSLVVYDHSDKEALRIVFLNRHALSITGIFRHEHITIPVIVTPEFMSINGGKMSGSAMGENNRGEISIEADK